MIFHAYLPNEDLGVQALLIVAFAYCHELFAVGRVKISKCWCLALRIIM